MSEARLNFVDHPDGTFSCQAIFHGGFDAKSHAHQAAKILEQYVSLTRSSVPEDGATEQEKENRPTLDTEMFLYFADEGESFRLRIAGKPSVTSPSYVACMQAKGFLEANWHAISDALMTREDGIAVVVSRETINGDNG